MNIAISAIRTKNIRINRHELVTSLQELGHNVFYIGQESNDKIHPDYEKFNVKFLPTPIGRQNTNPIRELKTLFKTRAIIKNAQIESIIVYGIRTFPTMVIASRLAGVKKILCIVNGSGRLFQLKGIKGYLVKLISFPMLWLSFLLTDNILFQNKDDLRMLKRKGFLWKNNYDLINGSGVNLEEYYISKLEEKPVFLMISRLTKSKGVNEYVKAARYVKSLYPEAIFNLIGPMDNEDTGLDIVELKKAVEEGSINLRGKVEDVRPYIKECRVFVLPSYHEGTPRTVLEAMAMGRPIITTDAIGCRETVIEGINGFKVPVRNTKILSEKMIWMIDNPKEVEKMGKESRRFCEKKYDVHEVNRKIIEKIQLEKEEEQ